LLPLMAFALRAARCRRWQIHLVPHRQSFS
jgi:hypothetical protein